MKNPAPIELIRPSLRDANAIELAGALATFTPSEVSHVLSRLEDDERIQLFELLPPETAADVIGALPVALASVVLIELQPQRAAAILNRLPSDDQTDLLLAMDKPRAQSILALMEPAEVEDVKRLFRFAADTAGGLMGTEFLAYPETASVEHVVADLRTRSTEYAQYPVQYVYVLTSDGRLQGVVRLRDLLFHTNRATLGELPLRSPASIGVHAGLNELGDFFDQHHFLAAPVVDNEHRIIGVVTRADFDDATADQAARTFMRFSGIVFGEEFRSMPLFMRVGGRLAWLTITMLLSFIAASVVGVFQATLSDVIVLAVFLPVISGMSGNAGNQAIAVTMRELSLGLVRPQEVTWVLAKEAGVSLVNGFLLGAGVMLVAYLWKGDLVLGAVVGCAQMLCIMLAACLGGVVPLALKSFGFDPAVASAPLLTTITDATGFFLTLGLASLWLVA
jgi:magnesium transporter